jgi:hypothetical protein
MLAAEGAKLLKNVIETSAYLPPLQTTSLSEKEIMQITNGRGVAKAPRFQKSNMLINWEQMPAADIVLRHSVFGRLWDEKIYQTLAASEQPTRIIFEELKDVSKEFKSISAVTGELEIGLPWAIASHSGDLRLLIPTAGNGMLEVLSCTIAGKKTGRGKPELLKLLTE